MKAKDIRRRTSGDLRAEVARLSKEVFEHRFKGRSEEKTDRGFTRRTRRDVARIMTVLRERETGAAAEPAGGKE
ncbi:MAG: 50S ribosomal protein L29 [Planctomycetes bacterium]|nr:50S ribosomal protein L29 [Planctomycetota bacterium]